MKAPKNRRAGERPFVPVRGPERWRRPSLDLPVRGGDLGGRPVLADHVFESDLFGETGLFPETLAHAVSQVFLGVGERVLHHGGIGAR